MIAAESAQPVPWAPPPAMRSPGQPAQRDVPAVAPGEQVVGRARAVSSLQQRRLARRARRTSARAACSAPARRRGVVAREGLRLVPGSASRGSRPRSSSSSVGQARRSRSGVPSLAASTGSITRGGALPRRRELAEAERDGARDVVRRQHAELHARRGGARRTRPRSWRSTTEGKTGSTWCTLRPSCTVRAVGDAAAVDAVGAEHLHVAPGARRRRSGRSRRS